MYFNPLPVIDNFNKLVRIKSIDLSNYYIISVQHLLESTGSLFEYIIELGFLPKNIFLTGKLYSTNFETQAKLKDLGINVTNSSIPDRLGYYIDFLENDICRMWNIISKVIPPNSNIIILDDGGYTLKNVPSDILKHHSVFGIEQTTSGIRMQSSFGKFPVIHVAASAAKTYIEPPIVSEAIRIRLGDILNKYKYINLGVIGFGNVGKAIVKEFKDDFNISIYDSASSVNYDLPDNVTICQSITQLYNNSEVIIGATGQDVSDLNWMNNSTGDKTLISVSSTDIEFNSILKDYNERLVKGISNPLQTLEIITDNGHKLNILRGGMVANFTGAADSSPSNIIQITRGLLFSAIIQIILSSDKLIKLSGPIMLDPQYQKELVHLWFDDQPQRISDYPNDILNGFKDISWIASQSAGEQI